MLNFKLFFLITTNVLFMCEAEDELVAVTALIRHGARIPESFYPNDPYTNFSWPYVLGDLTDHGVSEMYNVGKWLRKKYSPFLSAKYNPNQIYAQSLDYDRCIMTGEAVLAGLYPPIGDEIWDQNLLWQPIPIHVSPMNQDIIVNMNACPKLMNESALIRKTPTYKKIMTENSGLFEFIDKYSGEQVDFASIYPLFDTLYSELKLKLPLPKWAQIIWPKFLPLVVEYTKMDSLTKTERRIQVGPLLDRIIQQFDRAISGTGFGTTKTPFRKFMAYFATEWILYDLTYTLGLPPIDIPDFGALYLLELKRRPDGKYYVDILYRHSPKKGTRAVRVAIEGEKPNLSYGKFVEAAEPYMVNITEWVRLCERFSGQEVNVATDVPMTK